MRTEKINGHEVKIYDGIDELPITRFQAANKYMMIDAGLGSDLSAFDGHLATCMQYMANGDLKKAEQTLLNARESLHFVVSNVSPKMMAFACFVHSIDGVEYDDLTESGVNNTIEVIKKTKISIGLVSDLIRNVKKKLILNLKYISRGFQTIRGLKSNTQN